MFELTFKMPANVEGSPECQIAIRSYFISFFHTETYTYLPNPEVTGVAGNVTIERSVPEMQPAPMVSWKVWRLHELHKGGPSHNMAHVIYCVGCKPLTYWLAASNDQS